MRHKLLFLSKVFDWITMELISSMHESLLTADIYIVQAFV